MDAASARLWLKAEMPGLRITPIQPNFGVELAGLDLSRAPDPTLAPKLGPGLAGAIRALWLEHRLLVLRDQTLDHDGHMRLARLIGEPIGYPFSTYLVEGHPHIVRILSDQQTADAWHCDLSYDVSPAGGAVLKAVAIPPAGGDTIFADGYAAYDSLSEEMKARIADLHAIHDFAGVFRYQRADNPGHEARLAKAREKRDSIPLVAHPVVLRHPDTGRKTLFVNPAFCTRIVELDQAESSALLRDLFDAFMVPEHQLRIGWTPDAVVVWENLSTIHYAAWDYGDFRRHMERVTVRGTPLYTLS